jgi:2-polyprenyl-3-methyl-5-hydroxy-6-metoxy-1,4-benzoquinol methylase
VLLRTNMLHWRSQWFLEKHVITFSGFAGLDWEQVEELKGYYQEGIPMPHEHVCPWWMGFFLASPLRRIIQDPEKLLRPFINDGMRVLEIGPGMGFFTLPMARMVGATGKVIAVDVQRQMLDHLSTRAKKAGVADRIDDRLCKPDTLSINDLAGSIDFVLAIAVMHELPDRKTALREIHSALKTGGAMLMADPSSRFTEDELRETTEYAKTIGFGIEEAPAVRKSRGALLSRGEQYSARCNMMNLY